MKSESTSWFKNNNNYLEHLAIMSYNGKYIGIYYYYVIIYNIRHFIKSKQNCFEKYLFYDTYETIRVLREFSI